MSSPNGVSCTRRRLVVRPIRPRQGRDGIGPIAPSGWPPPSCAVRIAIIGAGIGGLTLAAALLERAISAEVEVFERDDSAFSRSQGYAIGLKHQTGLHVLGELGIREACGVQLQRLGRDQV